MESDPHPFGPISDTLRRAAATLRDAGIPFLLGGSLAFWARGGKETVHDLDLVVRPADAEAALDALAGAGMRPERPPEDWLYKAWDGEVLVDVIFAPSGLEIDEQVLARGEELEVAAVQMRVMSLEDALLTKLCALGEHALDYEPLLQTARSLREQVDWAALRERTAGSPYAHAFFVLIEELGVVDRAGGPGLAVSVRALESNPGGRTSLGPEPEAVR
jgi:putative nucleotidyltransferase-like protein